MYPIKRDVAVMYIEQNAVVKYPKNNTTIRLIRMSDLDECVVKGFFSPNRNDEWENGYYTKVGECS